MSELLRIGPIGREPGPVRAPASVGAARAREAGRQVVLRPAERLAPDGEPVWRGHRPPDPHAGPPGASAAFIAQALSQNEPEAALSGSLAADRAYRGAAALRVEILGAGLPFDLRV